MADMKIDLKGSLLMLLVLVGIFGVYKVIALIMLLVTGATANVAQSGDVAVPTVINDSINATVNSIADGYTLINAGDTIILGLIGLVVILKLFWPLISGFMGKTKTKGAGFN